MNSLTQTQKAVPHPFSIERFGSLWRSLCAGLFIPLGFAPFHLPGFAILGLALFFSELNTRRFSASFWIGFIFGLGFLGFGVSWVYVSIHEYGHLNPVVATFITALFVAYLTLFEVLAAVVYKALSAKQSMLLQGLLFSALWCLSEWLRSVLFGGFPWMLLGVSQMDTPLKYLLPIVGIYGVGFLACFASTCLVWATQSRQYVWLLAFVGLFLAPSTLQHKTWTDVQKTSISVAIIQANLSMRDKWDESLFWKIVDKYQGAAEHFIGQKQVIVMPESAIPVPASYVSSLIDALDAKARLAGSAILLGIPQPLDSEESDYFNTLSTLGMAQGRYFKQHLVPFGEYIPSPFEQLVTWLQLPNTNLKPGPSNQPLILVNNHPIAALICYELAYPNLLRKQLPKAEWVVSISDDGWFGHSLAMHQQLQIAQSLSIQTGRYQVVSNNDGLSAIINTQGTIMASLPAFTEGVLESELYPALGATPWVTLGDTPFFLLCGLVLVLVARSRYTKKP